MLGRRRRRRIDAYHLDAPEGWFPLPLKEADAVQLATIADQACPEEPARTVLTGMLRDVRREVAQTDSFAAAFWVPDAGTGVVSGVLALSFVLPDEGYEFTPERLAEAFMDSRPPGLEIHSRSAETLSLAAGPAVRASEIVSQKRGGEIEERVVYTVFPPEAEEALELAFACPTLQLGERLAEESAAIADSLTIALA